MYDRSFCIQNRNQSPIFVSDIGAETFFAEFLMFSFFFGEFKFWKAWNWAQIYQKKLKIFSILEQIWLQDGKNSPYFLSITRFPPLKFGSARYGISPKVLVILGFDFGTEPKPK